MDQTIWITILCTLVLLAIIAVAYHKLDHTRIHRGRKVLPHVVLVGTIVAIAFLVPTDIAKYVFSDLTVTAVGTVFPIYESIRAICTPEEDDDKAWLQYWMVGGIVFMCTGWVDDVMGDEDSVTYWYEAMLAFFLWLFFPLTDGAALIYDFFTKPFLTPLVRPLADRMDNWISYLYQTMINAVHLWLLWIIFMFLPAGLKRIVAIAIGTVYPWVSSVTASATEEVEDDTYWLTYWSCYGCLFLIMDILEVWLGWIPGFYTLIIFATVYLMLPMFQGADKLFRKVLVPLAGLKELLMLRDAIQVKKAMLKDLDPERATVVRKAIAKFFDDDDDTRGDSAELKRELLTGWHNVSFTSRFKQGGNKNNQTTDPQQDGAAADLSKPIV